MALALVNERTREHLAKSVDVVLARGLRRNRLLRVRRDPMRIYFVEPSRAVQTAFMRFAIDVIFMDRRGRVVRVIHGLPPWRFAVAAGAHAVVELPNGTLRSGRVTIGDHLYLAPASAEPPRFADVFRKCS